MLAYFDTSGHDDQTLREVHGLEPAPEYLEWALERGIFAREEDGTVVRGPRWGDVAQFGAGAADLERRASRLPAAYGFENAGPRPADAVSRALRANVAVAREAIRADLDEARLGDVAFRSLASAAPDRETHLADPAAGARLSPESLAQLQPGDDDVAVVVSDGLSAEAVHHAVPELLPVLLDGLAGAGAKVAQPIVLHRGRVKAAERIADALACRLVVLLIGERPGGDANASRSTSAYLVLRLSGEERSQAAAFSGNPDVRFEYSVVSSIHAGGLPPVEAGGVVARQALDILERGAAGNRLAAQA
jgi:ethanolamine ammonia-lyase large subunit